MRFNNEFAIRAAAAKLGSKTACMEFVIRPPEAVLLWWGLKHLEKDINDVISNNACAENYPETLRDCASAIEWCRQFRCQLGFYACEEKMEVAP